MVCNVWYVCNVCNCNCNVWFDLRIEHGGLGLKRDALFKEL